MTDNWGTAWPVPSKPDGWEQDMLDVRFNKPKNIVPTHDPYTNPDTKIYFECACGAIHDPGTKRFAVLTISAGNAGWKIRFGPEHYIAYCAKCGEDIE